MSQPKETSSANTNEQTTVESTPMQTSAHEPQKQKKNIGADKKKTTGKESFARVRALVGIALIVAAIIVALLLIPLLSGKDTVTYNVLYAKSDIPAGVQITDENINQYFEVRQVVDANVYQSGIDGNKARDTLVNCYTQRDVYSGNLVSPNDFSKTNLIYSDKVPEGKVLIGLDIPSLEGNVGYMPKAGDIITMYRMVEYEINNDDMDIYFDAANINIPLGQYSEGEFAEPYEYLKYVEIYAAIDGDIQDADANNTPEAAFVLIVDDGVQAQQVVEAANSGNYYFALASSGDAKRKDALLKLQDQIIEEGYNGAGREEYVFNLSDITISGIENLPTRNSTIMIHAAIKNNEGKNTVIKPEMLQSVRVNDIFDANGNSIALSEALDPEIVKTGSISLLLTQEQAELLESLINEGQVFATKVTFKNTQAEAQAYDRVNDHIWAERARYIMNNLTTPDGAQADTENKKDAE